MTNRRWNKGSKRNEWSKYSHPYHTRDKEKEKVACSKLQVAGSDES